MPALAIPFLIPFAEAAGIALGAITTGIGLKTLSDKVEDYIEDNPENAQKIFAMIMPEQGIANILKNESSEGDENISDEEAEVEEKPKLSGREKGMRIKEAINRARAGKGNYSSPDAEGPAVDIRGSVIREVEDMRIADPNLKDNYKPSGYTGWKRFANKGRKKYENGGGIGSMMQPKKVPMQGGVQNHLGEQKMVTVPQRWQSAENHPETELAYITKPEKNLLLKKDIHNSLNGSVNRGPEGVMSLNGWGSRDSNQNVSGATASAAETGGNTERDRADFRAAGMSPQLQQDFRNAAINAGAGQRVNPGFFDSSTFLSPGEIAGAKAYRQNPFNKYANQSYRNTGQSGIMNMIKSGGLFGNLIKNLGQKFGLGKKYNDTSTSISGDFNNNLPLGGSASFNNLDIRDKFNRTENNIPANITMANGQTITSDQINELGDGRSITSNQIDEFGDNRNINMDEFTPGGLDRSNLYENFIDNRDLVSETATSPRFNTSLINEFGDNRNINMDEFAGNNIQMQNYLSNQANYNADPFGNPNMDPRVTPEEYGLVGNNGIAGLTNSALPGNNMFAGLTKKQKMLLDQRSGMYPDILGAQEMLDNISSEDDPNDPATIKDIITYLG